MCVAATQVFHTGAHFPSEMRAIPREPTLCSSWAHCWGSAVRSPCSSWNGSPGSHSSLQACPGQRKHTSLVPGHWPLGESLPGGRRPRVLPRGCDLPQGTGRARRQLLCCGSPHGSFSPSFPCTVYSLGSHPSSTVWVIVHRLARFC